ncbi:Mak10-domain-containing protein [Piromyces finnis]|uniref:Mak10-domain-containing protein n=1 Tax=Piromyces finnis TaxID=1754191 RepID=A0A1Y1VMX5_9FUNG|nr:Mak10-domain-containing protein [Piromyces finnis]|eukprot:ORX60759.1 Mak10-domain-containing protein [Piromyces finnis]
MTYIDITDLVNRATEDFAVGQLLKKDSFTLYETMSAIEIMDPKMDSGMKCKKPKYDFNSLKTCSISMEQVIKIIDKLNGLEVQWLKGYMIYQTLLTCLFVNDPLNISNSYLKAYVNGLLKCCYYSYNYITTAAVYSEEDFVRDSTGFIDSYFPKDIPDAEIVGDLQKIEEELMKKLKNQKKNNNSNEELPEDPKNEVEIINSLLARIRFRRAFLNVLSNFVQSNKKNMNKIKKSITFASTQIPIMKETEETINADIDDFFDENINRKMYSQMPRVTVKFTSEETYEYYTNFFNEAIYLCSLTTEAPYQALINIAKKISGSSNTSTLLRAILHCIIFDSNTIISNPKESKLLKRMNLVECIKEWLISFCDPVMYMQSDNEEIKELMNAFYDRYLNSAVDCIRIYGYNRARLRRLLVKFITEWDKLQEECELLDNKLWDILVMSTGLYNEEEPKYYISSYIYHIKLLYLEEFLSLGIELEIFMKHELLYTYWYLHYLYDVHEDHLERSEQLQSFSSNYKKINMKSKDYNLEKNLADLKLSSYSYLYEKMIISAHKVISNAYVFMFIAFRKTQICKNPECEFDKENVRFFHRFKLFTEVNSPAIVPYEIFLQNIEAIQSEENSLNNCFAYAATEFNNAKQLLLRIKQFPDNVTQTQFYHDAFLKDIDDLLIVVQKNIDNINIISRKISIFMKIKSMNTNVNTRKMNINLNFEHNKIYPIIEID